jgi:hypothetical protein
VRILFDQGTPVPLRQFLTHHEVATAYECDWSRLKNGELLDAAEKEGFEVLVTADSNLHYQQNLKSRRIAIVVLSTPSWPRIQRAIHAVAAVIDAASQGSYKEIEIP